jgi:hypothetical protein
LRLAFIITVLSALTILTGCKEANPGRADNSGLGLSSAWGIPVIHVLTAGFNGYPSEPNNAGPVNGSSK